MQLRPKLEEVKALKEQVVISKKLSFVLYGVVDVTVTIIVGALCGPWAEDYCCWWRLWQIVVDVTVAIIVGGGSGGSTAVVVEVVHTGGQW